MRPFPYSETPTVTNVTSIRAYLTAKGWQRRNDSVVARSPDVWTLPSEQGTYEVIVPSSNKARDFNQRLAELLRTVAIAETRSVQDVLLEVITTNMQIVFSANSFDGIIFINGDFMGAYSKRLVAYGKDDTRWSYNARLQASWTLFAPTAVIEISRCWSREELREAIHKTLIGWVQSTLLRLSSRTDTVE